VHRRLAIHGCCLGNEAMIKICKKNEAILFVLAILRRYKVYEEFWLSRVVARIFLLKHTLSKN